MKVSIVTPSYNQGRFIERTLQSVASQSGALIEHVVFDGGSTDNTVEILENFRPPVRWVSKKDRGQADAVNQGISSTDGEIIGWLNSDDIYYPGAIQKVVEFFKGHPEVDIVYGMADHIDVNESHLEDYPTEPWSLLNLQNVCFICQPALFFRRRVVQQHGLLNESLTYCMDYEYWLRLGGEGVRFAYLEEKLAGSRMYPENKTLRARPAVHRETNDMLKSRLGRVPDSWLFGYAYVMVGSRSSTILNSAYAIYAALKWNHAISSDMRKVLYEWFCAGMGRLWEKIIRKQTRAGGKK